MGLTVGDRLGPYEILTAIDAGGMSARGHAPSCGHVTPWRPFEGLRVDLSFVEGRGISVSTRRGAGSPTWQPRWGAEWGPAASEKMLAPSP